ncbi:MAG: xanthine dehydrogenase family protein molybdopterin-binding subunit [Gemmatimonadota bacterium]
MDRIEGLAKLTGAERYVDDLPLDGTLWGMTVRSPAPRGRVTGVHFGSGVDWDEFVVVDHHDIPGDNTVLLIETDQPLLAGEYVRHVEEPVALIAHRSREMVRRAIHEIEVTVDPAPPIFDFSAEPTDDQIQHGSDNALKRIDIIKGDVDAALAGAAHVVEGEYRTGSQEHVYLENQGMIAWEENGVLIIKGSLQCPFYVLKAAVRALARDSDHVRIVQAPTGGGFGGKEEYPSMIALHAALLVLKAEQPVRIIYDRGEDMRATTKRHPSLVRHRTGVDGDGRLVAQDIDVALDGGAYVTLSPVVLSRGAIHAAGPYACANVRIRGRAMLTNSPPHGAFRGFGAPQTHFANERHMDVVAAAIGIDPDEFRRRNLIVDGQTTATGQKITDGTDRVALLDHALELSSYRERQSEHLALNASHPYLRRGIGMAAFHHGAGFTGSGLGLAPEQVVIADADTGRVPDSGPTVASRTTMVVGRLIERACDDLRRQLGLDDSDTGDRVTETIIGWHAEHDESLVGHAKYEPPPGIEWDEATYTGDAYATYGWATYVAEVEVDLRTYTARVTDFVAVQDVGTVLHQTLARGQIQGGVVQAIGWALTEECTWNNGVMQNNQLTNYIIPTSDDVPPIRVSFVENPFAHGPHGAKGLGELPMDGPAPAIANAVARAIDVDPREIPLTPEHLMDLVSNGR